MCCIDIGSNIFVRISKCILKGHEAYFKKKFMDENDPLSE